MVEVIHKKQKLLSFLRIEMDRERKQGKWIRQYLENKLTPRPRSRDGVDKRAGGDCLCRDCGYPFRFLPRS